MFGELKVKSASTSRAFAIRDTYRASNTQGSAHLVLPRASSARTAVTFPWSSYGRDACVTICYALDMGSTCHVSQNAVWKPTKSHKNLLERLKLKTRTDVFYSFFLPVHLKLAGLLAQNGGNHALSFCLSATTKFYFCETRPESSSACNPSQMPTTVA